MWYNESIIPQYGGIIMKKVFLRIVSLALTVITFLSVTLAFPKSHAAGGYSPEGNGVILNCAVVSDTHTDSNALRDRNFILRNAYSGIGRSSRRIDVLLNAGDITNSGTAMEYAICNTLYRTYINPRHYVACMGNHDSWNGSASPDYNRAKRLFLSHLRANGTNADNVYYYEKINSYYFICLGTEGLDHDDIKPVYSEKQLKWFDSVLTEAVKSKKPVFVLSHKPVAGYNNAGTDCVPSRVDAIMKAHATKSSPVIFFSGHLHHFGKKMYDRGGNVFYVNLPSTEYNDGTQFYANDKGGTGLVMEVYSDRVVLRARNFIKDSFIDGYRYVIPC